MFDEEDQTAAVARLLGATMGGLLILLLVAALLFLSSRPAGASHGQFGDRVSLCCDGVNRASGTSYRMVALAFQPYRYTPVFETGTQEIKYILQWPKLESTTQTLIRIARERLAVVLAVEAAPAIVKAKARESLKSQQTVRAIGMACLAGGIMLIIICWPRRKDEANGNSV